MPQCPHVGSGGGGCSCLWGGLLPAAISIFIQLFIFLPRPPCCFPCSRFPELSSPLWMPESKSEYSNCYQLPSRRAWLSPARSTDPPLQRKPQGAACVSLAPSYLPLPPRANKGFGTRLGRGKTSAGCIPGLSKVLACSDHSKAPPSPRSTEDEDEDEDVISDLLYVLIPLCMP